MDNPLTQYFRRPTVYLTLPSLGKDYTDAQLIMPETGEIPVYPMTAIDEITVRTPDALFNGVALVELVKSCIPAFIDPWSISSNDLDAVVIAIKAASSSNGAIDVETACPKCSESNTYAVNLVQLLAQIKPGDYSQTLPVGELTIKFKPLRYSELNKISIAQFNIQRTFSQLNNETDSAAQAQQSKDALEKITELTMDVLSKTIEYIATPNGSVTDSKFILEYLRNCDKNTFNLIRDTNAKLKADSEVQPLHIKCPECEHEYDQPFALNPVDFFG